MAEGSQGGRAVKRSNFFCGVVEGFYGRPWTTEQRKDLFQKLKKWNMDMYVYAPKDDYKHRAYWRELYTVEEAEHLTSLITAAKEQGVTFCYALSPGLDITYSSQKEIATLKRKLEQVSQFGCTCFALLFDDIEPEMSEADKQIFQSFAHAQVSVTNEVAEHLRAPNFLFCPTQYCSTRAMPNVNTSEYLHTLGGKLAPEIDILWTGPKVISKTLTTECIEEITEVLRRPPVIWDNLHANDYDQKRIFLGPYCGRSPELIPLLRGVLTNPNCEYNANMIAIRTLAHWASCDHLAPQHMESVSWDIKLEREGEQGVCEEEPPMDSSNNVYHPRQALRQAINEWLPEFMIPKTSQGPVIKPNPAIPVASVPLLPIVPHVNTCMSLTASLCTQSVSTSTSASGPLQLTTTDSNPLSTPIMNSLVSPTKVILNDTIPNPIIPIASNISIPQQLPVSTLPIPVIGMKVEAIETIDDKATPPTLSPSAPMSRTSPGTEPEPLDVDPPLNSDSDIVMNDTFSENGSMQVEPSNSPLSTDMMVEPVDTTEVVDESNIDLSTIEADASGVTVDDLVLLCELFYLPFEHGARGLRLLHDFHWLSTHPTPKTVCHETSEWRRRRCRFAWWCSRARRLLKRLSLCENRELYTELAPYMWDLCTVLALLEGFVRWLELGKCPQNATMQTQTSYTWFSKGWREAFESGSQEPWVFRGGVTADLRRLLPVEMAGEIGRPSPLVTELHPIAVIRMYMPQDEVKVCEICHKTCRDGSDCSELFPSDLQTLPADRLVAPFLTLTPEFCMLIEDEHDSPDPDTESDDDPTKPDKNRMNGLKPDIVGYACAALSSKEFYKRQEVAWIPEMCVKYPESLLERNDLSQAAQDCIRHFHSFADSERAPTHITDSYPSLLTCCILMNIVDPRAAQRLVTCLLAALRACGSNGVHVCINSTDKYLLQFYTKIGFTELVQEANSSRIYLGRSF